MRLRHSPALCFLSLVRVRLQRPAQLFVAFWFGRSTCPRKRGYCQQHPPNNQVEAKQIYGKTSLIFCLFLHNSDIIHVWFFSDPVTVVWRQRSQMMHPPVLPLLALRFHPETTHSGTAVAISQYQYLIPHMFFFSVEEDLYPAAPLSRSKLIYLEMKLLGRECFLSKCHEPTIPLCRSLSTSERLWSNLLKKFNQLFLTQSRESLKRESCNSIFI